MIKIEPNYNHNEAKIMFESRKELDAFLELFDK